MTSTTREKVEKLGRAVRLLREALGLTVAELDRQAEVAPGTVSLVEAGQFLIDKVVVDRLAVALKCPELSRFDHPTDPPARVRELEEQIQKDLKAVCDVLNAARCLLFFRIGLNRGGMVEMHTTVAAHVRAFLTILLGGLPDDHPLRDRILDERGNTAPLANWQIKTWVRDYRDLGDEPIPDSERYYLHYRVRCSPFDLPEVVKLLEAHYARHAVP